MKKVFLPLLGIGVISALIGCNQSSTNLDVSELDYGVSSQDEVVIKGTKISDEKKTNIKSITIPETIDGKSVKRINKGALAGFSNLESLTIPFIGAYEGSDYTSTYNDGTQLFGYIFGSDNYTGGYRTNQFYYNSDGYNASQFYVPQSLKNVSVTAAKRIPSGSFCNCCCINSINFTSQSSAYAVGEAAFFGCEDLIEVTLPNSVTEIRDYGFKNCYSLPTIALPTQLETICYHAFEYCTSLDYIVIPSKVQTIEDGAFYDCNDYEATLRSKYVNDYPVILFESQDTKWLSNAYYFARPVDELYYEDSGLEEIEFVVDPSSGKVSENSTMPIYPIIIGFTGKYGVTSDGFVYAICLEDGIEFAAICKYIESTTSNISELTIPSTVEVDSQTYNVREIAPSALQGLRNKEKVVIPGSIVYIGNFAFRTSKIGTLEINGDTLSDYALYISTGAFSRCQIDTFDISKRKVEELESGTLANSDVKNLIISDETTSIGYQAFYSSTLETVTFGKNSKLETIGSGAFERCSNLTEITIPKSVKVIESDAFYECTKLKTINFEEGSELQIIESNAFMRCSSLDSIDFSHCTNLSYLGRLAFVDCESLYSCNLKNNLNLKYIGDSCFEGTPITEIYIPGSVTSIGDLAFHDCNLSTVTFGTENSTTLEIGEASFAYCTNISKLAFPAHLTFIGNNAFRFCTGVNTITFDSDSSLSYIGNLAFAGLSNLSAIELPLSLGAPNAYVGAGVFDYREVSGRKLTVTLPFYNYEDAANIMFSAWRWSGTYEDNVFTIVNDGFSGSWVPYFNSSYYYSKNYSCYRSNYHLYLCDGDNYDNESTHEIAKLIENKYLAFVVKTA